MGGSLLKFRHWYTVKRAYYEILAKLKKTLILRKKIYIKAKIEKVISPKSS